jgi:2-dehydropantoate 2-reductase
MRIENVAIVGMGALGVMYGDFFTAKLGKEHVEFVADKARIDRFQQEGIFCNGRLCDFSMADEAESGRSADLLIFAVKATGLQAAIHTVRNKVSRNTIILSLLNGITSEEIIGKAYGMDPILHCIVQAWIRSRRQPGDLRALWEDLSGHSRRKRSEKTESASRGGFV